MAHLAHYLVVGLIVFGVNMLPAFGPPTWTILVLYRLQGHLNPVALVIIGAVSAGCGRLVLALVFRRWRDRFSAKRIASLEAVRETLERRKSASLAGLALFVVSPLPSAQLFEAAGLMKMRLGRFVAAFFAGRLISYSIYVAGAGAVSKTSVGSTFRDSLTDWRAIAVELLFVVGLGALVRVDWAARLGHPGKSSESAEPGKK